METPTNLHHSIQKGDCITSLDLRRCIPSRPDPPIINKVPSFPIPIPGRGVPVSCSVFQPVSEPKGVHVGSGCDDGSCSISGLRDSPLSRWLASEKPAGGPPQGSDAEPSPLNRSPGLDTQPGEIRVNPQLKTVFIGTHYHTDLGLMFPLAVRFREAASHAQRILLAKYVTAREFLLLLGRLVSMSDLVPLGRLRYRPLQLYLLAHWCPSQGRLADRIPLDHPFLDPFLKWWTKPAMFFRGSPCRLPFRSWQCTRMPLPAVGEPTVAVGQ